MGSTCNSKLKLEVLDVRKQNPIYQFLSKHSIEKLENQWGNQQFQLMIQRIKTKKKKGFKQYQISELFPKLNDYSSRTKRKIFQLLNFSKNQTLQTKQIVQGLTIIHKSNDDQLIGKIIYYIYSNQTKPYQISYRNYQRFIDQNKKYLKQQYRYQKSKMKFCKQNNKKIQPIQFIQFLYHYDLKYFKEIFDENIQEIEQKIVEIIKNKIKIIKGQTVYVFQYQWFLKWKNYMQRKFQIQISIGDRKIQDIPKIQESILSRSTIRERIERPGLIRNSALLTANTDELRNDLVEFKDFILLPEKLSTQIMGIYKAFPIIKREYPELYPINIFEVIFNRRTFQFENRVFKYKMSSRDTQLKDIIKKQKKNPHNRVSCMSKSVGKENWEQIKNFQLPIKEYSDSVRLYLCFINQSDKQQFLSQYNIQQKNGKKFLKKRIKNFGAQVTFPFQGMTKNGFVCQFTNNQALIEFRKDQRSVVRIWVSIQTLQQYNPPQLQKKINKNHLAGFRNYNQNCFINSIIQCIIRTPLFGEYLQKQYIKYSEQQNYKKSFTYQIYQIYQKSKKINIIKTKKFRKAIQAHFPMFEGSNHHDAQQLLDSILYKISQQIQSRQEYKKEVSCSRSLFDQSIQVKMKKMVKLFSDQSKISNIENKNKRTAQLFSGLAKKQTQCFNCKNKTQRYQSFFTYQLSLPQYKEDQIFFTFIPKVTYKINPIKYGMTLWKKVTNNQFIYQAAKLIGKKTKNLYFVLVQNGQWIGKLHQNPDIQSHSYKDFNLQIVCYQVSNSLQTDASLVEQTNQFSLKIQVQMRKQKIQGRNYEVITNIPFIIQVTNQTIWADTKLQIQQLISKHKSQIHLRSPKQLNLKQGKIQKKLNQNFQIRVISKQKENNKCLLCFKEFKSFQKNSWIWEINCQCKPCNVDGLLIKKRSFYKNYKNLVIVVDFQNPNMVDFTQQNQFHQSYHAAITSSKNRVDYLEDIIQRNFQSNEYVDLKCEQLGCQSKRAKRTQMIQIFPNILVLQLMRFRYKDGAMVKINNNVIYPQQFIYKDLKYNLYSVIVHKGSCNAGFYYSYVKCQENWYQCNDEVVNTDKKQGFKNNDAYLLFYKKSGFEPSLQSLKL